MWGMLVKASQVSCPSQACLVNKRYPRVVPQSSARSILSTLHIVLVIFASLVDMVQQLNDVIPDYRHHQARAAWQLLCKSAS